MFAHYGTEVIMESPTEHFALLNQGVDVWNRWRTENPRVSPWLSNRYLGRLDLSNIRLGFTDLRYATLEGANLHRADLSAANLRHANLDGARLTDADLIGTDLSFATLRGAILLGANLSGATVRGSDFRDALVGTDFGAIDLSEAVGLEQVRHEAPSTIGIDTIYKSRGKIPEGFLRGCGVPESFITQMESLVNAEDGIQFYSCFISYSAKDDEFARCLHGRMRDEHLRVWFAPEDIQGGKKLHEQIETAIHVYDKLLIVLSDASLQSEWVMDELRKGFKAERETGKRKLFPVRLIDYETLERWECRDSLSGKDLAEEVRQYFIPDFSNWKDHDQFEAAFSRLLKNLRAEERAA
jgi:uncharacterized protein YjbI with pentapeptide repeats